MSSKSAVPKGGKRLKVAARSHNVADWPDWKGIEEYYCGSKLTVEQICSLFSISSKQLYDRIEENSWPKRSEQKTVPTGRVDDKCDSQSAAPGETAPGAASGTAFPETNAGLRTWRKSMIVRLYEAMDRQLAEIEAQQKSGATISGADRERQTRQMNVMTRSMEKLTEFHEQEARRIKRGRKAKGQSKKAARDPESWRLEIARRITRIRERWRAEETAGDR